MASEFDHVFICVSRGGAEASYLSASGLVEGPPNTHPGQGTACRRFFFVNSYLELLWVEEPSEVQSPAIRPTHLWERWNGRAGDACPFGLGFRPAQPNTKAFFSHWEYRPPYLPPELSLQVATNADVIAEPMLFFLPFAQRPDRNPRISPPFFSHRKGLTGITRVEIVSPHADGLSPAFADVQKTGLVKVRSGPAYLLELGFDRESQGRQMDFRPALPLVFYW